jgi:tetratricopeptide (TPR) repeat protein
MPSIALCLAFTILLFGTQSAAQNNGLSGPHEAMKEYWSAFDDFEKTSLGQANQNFLKSWQELKDSYRKNDLEIGDQKLDALLTSAKKYQNHLEQHSGASSKPTVMLNLAIVLYSIGNIKESTQKDDGIQSKNEALNILFELEKSHPRFEKREQALYLRAIILDSLGRNDEALNAWFLLASAADKTIFGVYALLATGDHHFSQEKPKSALQQYTKANKILDKLNIAEHHFERLRVNYRIAWAAYRSANLDQVVTSALALLEPGRDFVDANTRERIQLDASELLGDALYETNALERTKSILENPKLLVFAPKVGLRLINRAAKGEHHDIVIDIGAWLTERHPLAKETPEILIILANSYKNKKLPSKQTESLEKLTFMLPESSLWRSQNSGDLEAIKNMEERATAAGKMLASWYYEQGSATGSPRHFILGAAQYSVLIEHAPNHPEANRWRLRQADCLYQANQIDEAILLYTVLKEDRSLSSDILQLSAFNLVLSHEKKWREFFRKAIDKGIKPGNDKPTGKAIEELARVINEYVTRFPNQNQSMDLLLLGAASYRDMDDLERANQFWQRTLISSPNKAQRGAAIRGLVYAATRSGSHRQLIDRSKEFLKLEDWSSLGAGLSDELLGVLSVATLDEGKRLSDSGQIGEAGQLLVTIAKEFEGLPNRGKIFRDGAYMLAISSDWRSAQLAAENFLSLDLKNHRGDMIYLLARAYEYQIKMDDAAKTYLKLANQAPKHENSVTSLLRAEVLAEAENNYLVAGRAAELYGRRIDKTEQKLRYFALASAHYNKAGQSEEAINMAKLRKKHSQTPDERMKSDLLLAELYFDQKKTKQAEQQFMAVAQSAKRQRGRMSQQAWSEAVGKSYFYVAEVAKQKFDRTELTAYVSNFSQVVSTKLDHFERLSEYYLNATESGSPEWTTASQFKLAETAENLANELSWAKSKSERSMATKERIRYEQQVQRLKELANRFHSSNLAARLQNPHLHRENEWIKMSAQRIKSGKASKDWQDFSESDLGSSSSISMDLPYQWSL